MGSLTMTLQAGGKQASDVSLGDGTAPAVFPAHSVKLAKAQAAQMEYQV